MESRYYFNFFNLSECYLNGLPQKAMRALAGLNPKSNISIINRATIEPDLEMQQMIFPTIEKWEKDMIDGINCEQTINLGGFFKLMKYLRKVLIQDMVIIQDKFPNHPLSNHELFLSIEFQNYKKTSLLAMQNTPKPMENRLSFCNLRFIDIVPEIAEAMNQIKLDLNEKVLINF